MVMDVQALVVVGGDEGEWQGKCGDGGGERVVGWSVAARTPRCFPLV
jgi:hypothetical protein